MRDVSECKLNVSGTLWTALFPVQILFITVLLKSVS